MLTYVAILAAQNNQALSQAKVWSLFRWAWLLAPAGGLAAAWGWRGLERRAWQGHPAFYPLLLTASHLACAMAVLLPPWPNDPAWPLHTLALALALYGAALLALRLPSLGSGSRVLEGVSVAGGPLAAVAVLAGFGGLSSLNPVQAAAVAAAGALLAWRVLRPGAPDRIPWNAADWVVLAVLLWWLLPWGPLPDLHHEGFYLGPVNDLLHGRAVLVGTSCQYGVGVVYGLAAIFTLLHLLPSFEGLWCLDALLFLAVYLAAYPFLRRLLHSRLLAVLAILVAAVAERFDPVLNVDNAAYPSVGPLRFGLPLLLLLAAWHRRQGGEPGLRPRLAEGLVLAVAGLWSLETLVYT
ncbi:MAG TPA: hypothetical protein VNZ67_13220, partial [bacterium]|nr:hypothetical protein [bacterium]